jgi:hypothetical protein
VWNIDVLLKMLHQTGMPEQTAPFFFGKMILKHSWHKSRTA